jgi:hypothetical protein
VFKEAGDKSSIKLHSVCIAFAGLMKIKDFTLRFLKYFIFSLNYMIFYRNVNYKRILERQEMTLQDVYIAIGRAHCQLQCYVLSLFQGETDFEEIKEFILTQQNISVIYFTNFISNIFFKLTVVASVTDTEAEIVVIKGSYEHSDELQNQWNNPEKLSKLVNYYSIEQPRRTPSTAWGVGSDQAMNYLYKQTFMNQLSLLSYFFSSNII